jgi:hypothetical protein
MDNPAVKSKIQILSVIFADIDEHRVKRIKNGVFLYVLCGYITFFFDFILMGEEQGFIYIFNPISGRGIIRGCKQLSE